MSTLFSFKCKNLHIFLSIIFLFVILNFSYCSDNYIIKADEDLENAKKFYNMKDYNKAVIEANKALFRIHMQSVRRVKEQIKDQVPLYPHQKFIINDRLIKAYYRIASSYYQLEYNIESALVFEYIILHCNQEYIPRTVAAQAQKRCLIALLDVYKRFEDGDFIIPELKKALTKVNNYIESPEFKKDEKKDENFIIESKKLEKKLSDSLDESLVKLEKIDKFSQGYKPGFQITVKKIPRIDNLKFRLLNEDLMNVKYPPVD